ncbi:MAG: ABC transporter permease [Rhizobiales bacterium]|jgi:peptide/nickel transport system permease protein|nr:ABC transporter permease [Hyphomicrobiales bacterium]
MLEAMERCPVCARLYAIVVRLAYSALVLLLVAIVAFVGLRLAPGDVTTQLLDPSRATPQELAFLRHQLGLDQPIHIQFLQYLAGLLQGDLGLSLITRETVVSIVANAGIYSISLAVTAFVLIFALAIPLGLTAAIWRGSAIDAAVRGISGVMMATPNFVLAVVLINLLAVQAGWLPVAGSGSWKHLVLPALVLAAEPLGFATRLVRTSYLEQAGAQYADAMRMRGLSESVIRWRHIMRNALLPVISLGAVQVRTLVGYTLIVETIFRWPGLGKRLVDSVLTRDYQVAQGLTILLAAVVVVATLVSSFLYRAADPRVRDE